MSADDIKNEITKAWSDFIDNTEGVKEEILCAFNEEEDCLSPLAVAGVVSVVIIGLAAFIYFAMSFIKKKNESSTTKKKKNE